MNSSQFRSSQDQQRGVQKGFGATLNVQAGSIIVLQSVPNSPFGRAGIGPGDRIVRINGRRFATMDLQELVEVLHEARSGRVQLSILQSGTVVPRDFDLSPAEVPQSTVDKKFLLGPGIAYLHVGGVEVSTPTDMKSALEGWREADLRGLVLDLRDNPGGVLEAAVSIVSLFLRRGKAVVSLQGRNMPCADLRCGIGSPLE